MCYQRERVTFPNKRCFLEIVIQSVKHLWLCSALTHCAPLALFKGLALNIRHTQTNQRIHKNTFALNYIPSLHFQEAFSRFKCIMKRTEGDMSHCFVSDAFILLFHIESFRFQVTYKITFLHSYLVAAHTKKPYI